MKTLTTLQLITLANLSKSQGERKTPYEIMTEVNQVFSAIDTPYSPGAFYPALKRLSDKKMININQSGCLIEHLGITSIETDLLHHPLPGSFLGILYKLMAANIQASQELQNKAIHRIEIELIKFDHNSARYDSNNGATKSMLKMTRQQIAICLRRISSELGDQNKAPIN